MSHLARRLLGMLQVPLWVMLQWVPKDPSCWVFGAWNGQRYSDNARYLFEEVLRSEPDIRPIWIAKSGALLAQMRSHGLPVESAHSLRGLWLQARAGVVIFSHSVEWDLVPICIGRRCLRVQGWHGIPIKKIGYLDEMGVSRRRAAVISRLFPHRNDRCDLVLAAGDYDQEIFREAFNVAPINVVKTGYPRYDPLWSSTARSLAPPQHFIYLPTLREHAGQFFDLFVRTNLDWQKFDAALGEAGLSMSIKLHPVQRLRREDRASIENCRNISLIPESTDISETLDKFDGLITDVSSVYFDFIFCDRPIITALLDMRTFSEKTRNLLSDPQDFDLGYPADDWDGVLAQMRRLRAGGTFQPDEAYRRSKARFFSHADGRSARRVIGEIRRRLRQFLPREASEH